MNLITRMQAGLRARREKQARLKAERASERIRQNEEENQVRRLYFKGIGFLPSRTIDQYGYTRAHFSITKDKQTYEISAEESPSSAFGEGTRDMLSFNFPDFSATLYSSCDFGEHCYYMNTNPGGISPQEIERTLDSINQLK